MQDAQIEKDNGDKANAQRQRRQALKVHQPMPRSTRIPSKQVTTRRRYRHDPLLADILASPQGGELLFWLLLLLAGFYQRLEAVIGKPKAIGMELLA